MVEVKTEKSKEILPILIRENKNTQPLLGLGWLDKMEIGLQGSKKTNVIRHVEEERRKKFIDEDEDLFKNNPTIKDLTIDIQLKKRRQTHTTKRTAGSHPLSKNCSRGIKKINWKGTS